MKIITRRKTLLLLALFAVVLLLYIVSSYNQTIPEAPVYPHSELEDERSYTNPKPLEKWDPLWVDRDYVVVSSVDKIVTFYQEQGAVCRNTVGHWTGDKKVICEGDAKPFGTYEVFINEGNNANKSEILYSIHIEWEF